MTGSFHTDTEQILVFTIDSQLFALMLSSVQRVIHSIEIRSLPNVPDVILGIINVNGRIIPVGDIRSRLGLKPKEIGIDDQLIVAVTGIREIAVLVDSVLGIRTIDKQQISDERKSIQFADNISGVAKIDDDLALIYDLEKFLSINEEAELASALNLKPDEA